jgi:hypothetical protein
MFLGMKAYNALPVPILVYGNEIWALGKRYKKYLASIEGIKSDWLQLR